MFLLSALALFVASSITALNGLILPLLPPLLEGARLCTAAPIEEAIEAYGLGLVLAAAVIAAEGRSEASKKGDSVGWILFAGAGDVARWMLPMRDCVASACSSEDSESESCSASGDGMMGTWLLEGAVEEASLVCRTGNRPFSFDLPTVTCLALARTEEFGEGPWPATMTGTSLATWSTRCSGGVPGLLPESGVGDLEEPEEDFTETIRGVATVKLEAGIGAVVASSHCTSDATESLASEGVMESTV